MSGMKFLFSLTSLLDKSLERVKKSPRIKSKTSHRLRVMGVKNTHSYSSNDLVSYEDNGIPRAIITQAACLFKTWKG